MRREPNGELLVGNSDHSSPEIADPDSYSNRADDGYIEVAVGKLERLLPEMPDPRLASSYAGCYDITPDYNPIIGPSPRARIVPARRVQRTRLQDLPRRSAGSLPICCSTESRATRPSTGTTSATPGSPRANPLTSLNPLRRRGRNALTYACPCAVPAAAAAGTAHEVTGNVTRPSRPSDTSRCPCTARSRQAVPRRCPRAARPTPESGRPPRAAPCKCGC